MFNPFKKKEPLKIEVELICPDGFSEWLMYRFPEDAKGFCKFISEMSKEEGYSFNLRTYNNEMALTECLSHVRKEKLNNV